MKALVATVVLALAIILLGQTYAEAFNRRGDDFFANLSTDPKKSYEGAALPLEGFVDRSGDLFVTLPAGSATPHQGAVIPLKGFNRRD